ncbi:NAD(P)-binding protein [Streptomyces sp. NPDC060311]|uniref:NAD(P)-binding protein n=1 Tax=Streptomyces TaxID=1883 RepID=UPI0027E28A3D|nr:NAD(P)-binding protein [Streptomyces coelicoflavus]
MTTAQHPPRRILIVGAGLAGASAAAALREQGFDGDVTLASAPAPTRRAWQDAGAEVVVAGEDAVDLAAAVAALTRRGLRRIDCEGDPTCSGRWPQPARSTNSA